jgi:uncharacterized protein
MTSALQLPEMDLSALPEDTCTKCGACCANFRVSFYGKETDAAEGGCVPGEYTQRVDEWRVCMRGTQSAPIRCVALEGTVGEFARCAIYDRRPSPCRRFGLRWKAGRWFADAERLRRCNAARRHWRLPPIPGRG